MTNLFATPQAESADIGVVGMAVMGSNLARNLAHHGHSVAVFNRHAAETAEVIEQHGSEGTFVPADEVGDFVASIRRPRRIIMLIKAGQPTDDTIQKILPHLETGDILMDGGNSYFEDTIRRESDLASVGINFVGSGISGGEEGALNGPSIMPGGSVEAYKEIGPVLEQISAHVDGVPCCTHVGPNGAGHFVKMVHNGIEYADMQLIAESYDLLRRGLGATTTELADIYAEWNKGELESFLIEITADVLRHVDAETGKPFIDVVVDQAQQKGTGKWTVQTALDLAIPVTGIAEATFARALSGQVIQRELARQSLPVDAEPWNVSDRDAFIEDVRQALYASKTVAYSQGFDQIAAASAEHDWNVDRGAMARIWRGGCIIRAQFLNRITDAYEKNPDLPLLISDPYFVDAISKGLPAWRRIVAQAALYGVPVPAFGSSLSYYDGLLAGRSTASLIQGLRDLFGAHTYQRVDKPGVFHTLWSGDGSEVQVS